MIIFTNGCFDVLHPGHIKLLEEARELGTKLIVGINSDESIRKIKGNGRPVMSQEDRRSMLLALRPVDDVCIFNELTPEKLIKEIKPDVLVKGGDWKPSEIIGADFVKSYGGKVVSIPLVDGYSTSEIVGRLNKKPTSSSNANAAGVVEASLKQHRELLDSFDSEIVAAVYECSTIILDALKGGGKVLICGNGGSAADAQHIAAELTGRYEKERKGLPAIALTTDTSALTAIANDFGYARVFARQIEALARKGDCLIAISTSGESESVIAAVMAARNLGCKVVGMTGAKGKKLASLCDACLLIPSDRTARIQEMHITIGHIWCELVDSAFASS